MATPSTVEVDGRQLTLTNLEKVLYPATGFTKAAVVDYWRAWFSRNEGATFEAEDVIVCDDRAVVLWIYRKMRNGQPWLLRGVDVFTVRGDKVAAKLAYVKG